MRWIALILLWVALLAVNAEPEPKKYKSEVKTKEKQTNSSLTDDERKFLREVESKFGIKPELIDSSKKSDTAEKNKTASKQPFPGVIAIEIVNDTDTSSKGKRTIDANLGYGYRTNMGYTYTYFGKPSQDKGKFMIYPYSQEDIPPSRPTYHNYSPHSSQSNSRPNVEIQPSKAFELIPVKEQQQSSYQYRKPVTELQSKYENVKGLETPPPPYSYNNEQQSNVPSTLYTTYNGEQLAGLSGQFPKLMNNYFVDPSQLLQNPQYQSAGLTQEHLRPHGPHLEQRVVPVLVLRIPSSYLRNPTAELYANLPRNYPLSQHLNNVNLQALVNQYFKKNGYSHAPQVMTFQNSLLSGNADASPVSEPVLNYEPQQYANPYVQPTYTQADYSGVQYSAVQPVMAKYPSSYSDQQYSVQRPQIVYQQPMQQQYEYQYQYMPQSSLGQQMYYIQQQYQQQSEDTSQQSLQNDAGVAQQHVSVQDSALSNEYGVPQQPAHQQSSETPSAEYGVPPQQANAQYTVAQPAAPEETMEYSSKGTVPLEYKLSYPSYLSKPAVQYGSPNEETQSQEYYGAQQKETVATFPSAHSHTVQNYHVNPESGATQRYLYQKQGDENSASNTLVISENYPSKDHTVATVLPLSYKASKKQHSVAVQSVDYVTPVPSSKYQSQYKTMVPRTVLKSQSNEKVTYVNSHTLPMHYAQVANTNQEYNPEEEYTVSSQYIPLSSQKAPSYPRNYHSHPKRMVKPEKTESTASTSSSKKSNGKSEKKSA